MSGKKIVILGGGFGGAASALTARKLLGREHSITLVDRSKRTYLCGSFPLLIVGERKPEKVSRSLGTMVNRGVDYRQTRVEAIDTTNRIVITDSGVLEYDYLVVALGASYDWDDVPGSASAYSFYGISEARRLRDKLRYFKKGLILISVSSTPYKCPPAPYEAAMVLDWAFKERGIRDQIDIKVFTPEPATVPVAGPESGKRLNTILVKKGIELHAGVSVAEISRDGREAGLSDGQSVDAELIVTIPTHRVSEVAVNSGLADANGWIEASSNTLETATVGVYAIGDINSVPMATGKPLPKAGVFASAEGQTVGANIAAEINETEPVNFPGTGYCFIAYSGTQAGMIKGNFLAKNKPIVALKTGTARGFKAKERFERDWRRFRI